MKISVVIPNYNGANLLRKNLKQILERVKDCEIIIVDDASTDESVEIIKQQIYQMTKFIDKNGKLYGQSRIKLITNERNRGFANTVNRGVEMATGGFIVLINNDVLPDKNFLKPALRHFEDKKVFAVGCLQKEAGRNRYFGRGVGKFEEGFLIHRPGSLDKNNTLWVFGGAGIFRKSIWERLGGLNPIYSPFYWEDIDLSYRALKSGYKLIFEVKSVVTHFHDKSVIRALYSDNYIKAINFRNQILFVWVNINDKDYILSHLINLPIHLMRAFINGDLQFIKGFFLALIRFPKAFYYRIKVKKLFKIKDREIVL